MNWFWHALWICLIFIPVIGALIYAGIAFSLPTETGTSVGGARGMEFYEERARMQM